MLSVRIISLSVPETMAFLKSSQVPTSTAPAVPINENQQIVVVVKSNFVIVMATP